jgi:hypothetical protein
MISNSLVYSTTSCLFFGKQDLIQEAVRSILEIENTIDESKKQNKCCLENTNKIKLLKF